VILKVLVLLTAGLLLPRQVISSPIPQSISLTQNQLPAMPWVDSAMELDWSAPAECPDGEAVRSAAISLTGAHKQNSRHLKARGSIRPADGTGWILSLTTDLDGVTGERTLAGDSCQSLTDAAVLMLALILNPDLASPSPKPALDQKPAPPSPIIAPAIERPPRRRWRVGASAGIQMGVLRDPSSSFALSFGVARGRLSLRLVPGLTPPRDVFADTQRKLGGRLWLGTIAALGCWSVAIGWFELGPCFGLEATRLHGHGLGVLHPRQVTAYWSSAELAAFVGLPVGHGVLLEVGGIGLLPLSRPSVYLDEIGPVSRPASLGFSALGGLAWFFE
jgi:hypothetical protein